MPADKKDFELVLNIFLLEKSLVHFNDELNNRPEWVITPLRMIRSIMDVQKDALVS